MNSVLNLTPNESKYKRCEHLQRFPSNISRGAFTAWSLCGWMGFIWRTVDYYSSAELQAAELCRSPICGWQRRSAFLLILCSLTPAPAWNGELGVSGAAFRAASICCSAPSHSSHCRLDSSCSVYFCSDQGLLVAIVTARIHLIGGLCYFNESTTCQNNDKWLSQEAKEMYLNYLSCLNDSPKHLIISNGK